jgi:hypothetical protein
MSDMNLYVPIDWSPRADDLVRLSWHVLRHWPRKTRRRFSKLAVEALGRETSKALEVVFAEARARYSPPPPIPVETIEAEVDGTLYEFRKVADASEAEVARALLGVVTLEGTDGSHWVAERILRFSSPPPAPESSP